MQSIIEYFKHPVSLLDAIVRHFGQWLPDIVYLKLRYRFQMGERLNLSHPHSFNEKLQWLKLYNQRDEYTTMVDKYAVKEYISEIIGKDHIIPTLGIWERPEEIDWDSLPNQFVLKTTHGGGGTGVVICKDKATLNRQEAIKKLSYSLNTDIYRGYREWPYKNVKKRILAENYMLDQSGELRDYKFFCFNGKVKIFKVDFNRFSYHQANYYDREGRLLPFGEKACPPNPNYNLSLPSSINEMMKYAEIVAHDNPFLRVDFYDCSGKVYFGEITFFPAGGMGRFVPDEWDTILGEWLALPPAKR